MSGKALVFFLILTFAFGAASWTGTVAQDNVTATFPCHQPINLPNLVVLTPNWPLAHPPISCCAVPGGAGSITTIRSAITPVTSDGTISDDTVRIDSMTDEGVKLPPGTYQVTVTEKCMPWAWEEGDLFLQPGRLGKREPGPGPLSQISQRDSTVSYTFLIRVACEGTEPDDECPLWDASMTDQALENYENALRDRHHVQARLERHRNTLANCPNCRNRFFRCIVCRAAQSAINRSNREISGYVDDCERILDILSRPGIWNDLIGCLRILRLDRFADSLETNCHSPEDICSTIHNRLMGFAAGAETNASAYRRIPSCFRPLYPNQRTFDSWYLRALTILG